MPKLSDARHELFAAMVRAGSTASEAFETSGLAKSACSKHASYYVYILVDPRTDTVFYVGKGCKRRYAHHVRDWRRGNVGNAEKFSRIGDIIAAGLEPLAYCVADNIDEDIAFALERGFIQAIGWDVLTNAVPGQTSEREKAAAYARHALKHHVPTFCSWFQRRDRGNSWVISREVDQRNYWDIVGAFHEVANRHADAA